MTKTKTMLIAAHELSALGAIKRGDLTPSPVTLAAGQPFDDAAQKALGLSDEDVADLMAKGAIVEIPLPLGVVDNSVLVAQLDELKAALAVAELRATTAEAELATLKPKS